MSDSAPNFFLRKEAMFWGNRRPVTWACMSCMSLLLVDMYMCRSELGSVLAAYGHGLPGASVAESRLTCALSLTRSQLADTTHFTMLGLGPGLSPWIGSFVEATHIPVTFLQIGDEEILVHNLMTDVVFVGTDADSVGNRSIVERALTQVKRSGLFYARVVFWWLTGDAQEAMKAAQDLEMVRVLVVNGSGAAAGAQSASAQNVFGYREECENGSLVTRAVLARACHELDLPLTHTDLFPDVLRMNFRGCPLRLSTAALPPFIEVRVRPKGGCSLAGVYAPLALFFSKFLNATLLVQNKSLAETYSGFGKKLPNGTGLGLLRDLSSRRSEVFFGYLIRTSSRNKIAVMSPSFHLECFTFAMPSGLGAEASPWDPIYRELSPHVWLLVATAYFLVTAVLSLSGRDTSQSKVQDAAFSTLSTLLGNTFVLPVTSLWARVLLVFWFVFCIVINTAYQAMRNSLVVAPHQRPEINSLSQLLQSRLTIVGLPVPNAQLKRLAIDEGNSTILALSKKIKATHSLNLNVHRMAAARDVSVMDVPLAIMHFAAPLETASGHKLVHIIQNYCALQLPMSNFVLRRGSRLSPMFTDFTTRLLDMGIYENLYSVIKLRHSKANQSWTRLDFSRVLAAFLLLVVGIAVSTLVFTIEVFVHNARVFLPCKQTRG